MRFFVFSLEMEYEAIEGEEWEPDEDLNEKKETLTQLRGIGGVRSKLT